MQRATSPPRAVSAHPSGSPASFGSSLDASWERSRQARLGPPARVCAVADTVSIATETVYAIGRVRACVRGRRDKRHRQAHKTRAVGVTAGTRLRRNWPRDTGRRGYGFRWVSGGLRQGCHSGGGSSKQAIARI